MSKRNTPSDQGLEDHDKEPLRARGTDRLLDILDFFVSSEEPKTRNAIAVAVDAPRSTVYVLVEQLIQRGYLEQEADSGLISLGPRISQLGNRQSRLVHFERMLRQLIERLASELMVVAEINVIDSWQQLVLFSASGTGHSYLNAVEGTRYPLPWTAAARFLLEGQSERELLRHIPSTDFDIPGTGEHLTSAQLMTEIKQAQKRGYQIAAGLMNPYIGCIAAPLRNRSGRCVAVVSLVMPLSQLDGRRAAVVDALLKTAAELNDLLKTTDEFPWPGA